jgi:hypothetical protein
MFGEHVETKRVARFFSASLRLSRLRLLDRVRTSIRVARSSLSAAQGLFSPCFQTQAVPKLYTQPKGKRRKNGKTKENHPKRNEGSAETERKKGQKVKLEHRS